MKEQQKKAIVYEVVEHDGGWAYKAGDTFSESFDTHEDALAAAKKAAAEQGLPGTTEAIEYQDERGEWHEELAGGDDRPEAVVEDAAGEDRSAMKPRTPRRAKR